MPRTFTLAEARAALPTLRPLMARLRNTRARLAELAANRAKTGDRPTNGHRVDAAKLELEAESLRIGFERDVESVRKIGCEVKDFDTGLLDFRALFEGREIYLCWRLGEDDITHWHELEAGFAGREPLTPDMGG